MMPSDPGTLVADNETAWARRSLTVQDLVLAAFRRYPHRPCIVWEGGAATYSETAQRVGRMAMWLQSNIERTEHVGVALPNSREYLEAILALALAGRAYVAISPHDPVDAQLHKLRHADVKALFVEADAWEPLEKETEGIAPIHVGSAKRRPSYDSIVGRGSYHETKLTRPRPEEVFALGFSGGTSGLPKGVEKNHPQHIALMRNLLEDVFLPSEQTTFVAATPLTHAAFAFVIPTLLRGGSLSWLSRFDAGRIVDNSWLPNRPRIQTFLVPTALGDVADAASPSHSVDTIV
jgi:fatty-acyl-CoA synthase